MLRRLPFHGSCTCSLSKTAFMKLFSLATKKHVVGWSVIGGLVVSQTVYYLTLKEQSNRQCFTYPLSGLYGPTICEGDVGIPENTYFYGGWPLGYSNVIGGFTRSIPEFTEINFWLNLLFWGFIVGVILSLVRWGRYRSSKLKDQK